MDSERIDELLNKYWKCETSLEEEQEIKTYFQKNQIPDNLRETGSLFQYFHDQKAKALTEISFDKTLRRKIQAPARGRMASLVFNAMRIAAGIVVLVVAVWLVRLEVRESSETTDTYDDPQMAFEETKKALMMISKSFSTAEEQAKKINLFNEAQQDLRKEKTEVEL